MASVEVFFGTIVAIFCLIGLVRGFLKELGVALVMMFLLFFLSQFEPQLGKGLQRVLDFQARVVPNVKGELFPFLLLAFVIVGAAFVSYQGETLAYAGQALRGAQAVLLGLVTGLLNGYLIAGSLWYYMDLYHYPVGFLGFSADRLSPTAQAMIKFLPIPFFGQPVLFNLNLFLYLGLLLLIARVIR